MVIVLVKYVVILYVLEKLTVVVLLPFFPLCSVFQCMSNTPTVCGPCSVSSLHS